MLVLLTKLNKQYGTRADKYAIGALGLAMSSMSSFLISAVAENNYLMLMTPVLFLAVVGIQNGITHSEHKRIIESIEKNFIELKKIIDSGKFSSKSSKFEIERKEDEYYAWYEIKKWKGYPPVVSFEYDKENNEIASKYDNDKDVKKYFKKESEEILESLKCMILESENKSQSVIGNFKIKEEEKTECQDEITQKIQDLITKSCAIAQRNEKLLSVEEKHILVSSIPADLKELKELYLSFSDESKENKKENIKRTMSVLEKRIMFISMNMEKIKEEKLELLEQKILKKHSS